MKEKTGIISLPERSCILSRIQGAYCRSGLPVAFSESADPILVAIERVFGLSKKSESLLLV